MSQGQEKRVLVIDRDAGNRKLLCTMIRERSFEVDEAANGSDAIEVLQQHRYSVVLLDLPTSRQNQHDVLRIIAELQQESVPVVIVVADPDEEIVESFASRHIHGIIRRPFDPEELATLVRACAEIKSCNSLGTMCLAMIAGSPLLAMITSRF